jgi:hypothetical protein
VTGRQCGLGIRGRSLLPDQVRLTDHGSHLGPDAAISIASRRSRTIFGSASAQKTVIPIAHDKNSGHIGACCLPIESTRHHGRANATTATEIQTTASMSKEPAISTVPYVAASAASIGQSPPDRWGQSAWRAA